MFCSISDKESVGSRGVGFEGFRFRVLGVGVRV